MNMKKVKVIDCYIYELFEEIIEKWLNDTTIKVVSIHYSSTCDSNGKIVHCAMLVYEELTK